MEHPASAIARDLAGQAERLCRHYLSTGRREGNYWLVGDVRNTPGRSLYVRLRDAPDGVGRAGKWTDAQSGDHGDLLDILRAATSAGTLAEALIEARRFLRLPALLPSQTAPRERTAQGSSEAGRRLFAMSQPLTGTLAESYLRKRGLPGVAGLDMLRFHPRCWYRRSIDDRPDTPSAMPAMIAAVTDDRGRFTGVHRTWLTTDGTAKADVAYPRRTIGLLLGNGVRFGSAAPIMAAGEGIETMLSLRAALPSIPAVAALSAAHLAAVGFPRDLRRLYVARESDPAGSRAFATLSERAATQGIELLPLDSVHGDLNADLQALGLDGLRKGLLEQLHRSDRA